MATSRLAAHLPSLFGPSRRAAWRLSLVRRALAAGAILLALHLTLGAASPAPVASADPTSGSADPTGGSGPALTLALAAPADHLEAGDEVGVYLPGDSDPVIAGARVLSVPTATTGRPTVRITLPDGDVGRLVAAMGGPGGAGAGGQGFVVVREG